MSDDRVGCEWVSVSSGAGLPGFSRTKAVKLLCVCWEISANTSETVQKRHSYNNNDNHCLTAIIQANLC